MITHTLHLPWVKPPLSLNRRGHWATRSRQTRAVREAIRWIAASAKLPKGVGYATVQLHYLPADNRRRDTDNLVATLKPLCDGLVDYGLVPDDTPEFMAKPEPIIHTKRARKPGRMWLTIDVYDDCQYPY